jgi:hypothetical protein
MFWSLVLPAKLGRCGTHLGGPLDGQRAICQRCIATKASGIALLGSGLVGLRDQVIALVLTVLRYLKHQHQIYLYLAYLQVLLQLCLPYSMSSSRLYQI